MLQHVFSMLVYGMIVYALLMVSIIVFWGVRAYRFSYPEVTADNLESTIRGWLYNSGLSTKRVSDPAWIFGLMTTLPNGESLYVIQMKESRRFITFEASLAVSPEQQAILKTVPPASLEKLMREVVLKVFLARMALTIQMQLSEVLFSSQLAIIPGPLEEDFFEHLDDIDNAIILAGDAISRATERVPRLVDQRDIGIAKRR